jgi:alpha-glucosidase
MKPRRKMPVLAVVLLAALVAVAAARTSGDREWTVASPDGALTATVAGDGDGYAVTVRRRGRRVLETRLGHMAGHGPGAAVDIVDDSYATPAGKRRRHRLVARRLTLSFGRARRLELLVADDGVALRRSGARGEAPVWHAPRGTRAWLQSYRPDYEGRYNAVALGRAPAGDYGFPALLDTGGGTWALLTESGLTREPAARLSVSRDRPGGLAVTLPAHQPVPRTSVWRVALVGGLQTIVDSDLPVSLGRPSRIADTSWIRPGRVAWSWWSDRSSPGDLGRQRAYVRAAAAHRWEYVLLDEGWHAEDMPRIARYAARRGVRVLLWTPWDALREAGTRERLLSRWASWGVAGVKVDFLLSDSAARMAIYDDIARDAARHHLVVDFHGCTVPRGIQRTWPNVLTMEAVRGAERETPDQGTQAMDARHDVDLVFTRNVLGSMDYTPVTFSAGHRDTTDAHRLALAVVYESGLQHFADSPESYAGHPQATRFLSDVPATWDDTRLLAGAPDRGATVARRAGSAWWIGSISATDARRQTVPLRFLGRDRTYRLHLVRDDGHGGLAVEDRTVTAADRLPVFLERNGGFAAELTPQG